MQDGLVPAHAAANEPAPIPHMDKDLLVYPVGRDIVPFSFSPLIPPPGTDPYTWLKKLIEIIAQAHAARFLCSLLVTTW